MLGDDSPENALTSGALKAIISVETLTELQKYLRSIRVRQELMDYIVDIVRATREHQSILVGAGPRATQALLLASRALAAIEGRDFVTPDDVKLLARPVIEHRLILRPEYEIEGLAAAEVIQDILREISVPR
jgi:MoxR-like ATPase